MLFKRTALALFFCLLFFGSVFAAISASEAVDFVETENNFLKENDRVESPNVLIRHDSKKYWVVPLLAGEGVATFFPVLFADKSLSNNKAVNSQLFSTGMFLRDYLVYRNTIAQQNKRWFMGRDSELIIGELANNLQSEVFELNIIKARLSVPISVSGISEMQESLSRMASLSSDLSNKISVAIDAEASFTVEPDTSDLESIQKSFNDAFSVLFELEAEARDYDGLVSNLQGVIANDDALSVSEKNQFVALAEAPSALFTIGSASIGNWVIAVQETSQRISQILTNAKSKVFLDSAQLELEKRVKRSLAFSAIYSFDKDFSEKTDYPSLKVALDDLQSPANKDYWENQGQLQLAIEQFVNAVNFLNGEEFESSLIATQKSKRAVELVVLDGFFEAEPASFDTTALISVFVIVLLLVIVLYFLRNRQKIVGAVFSQPGEEEVDVYGWQKK